MRQEWTFIDKSKWPVRGEWDNEPDKVQWQDHATGFVCLAVRASAHWCGYVGVPEGHPAFEAKYDDVRVKDSEGDESWPDVHGGLTFGSFCQEAHERPANYSVDENARVCHVAEPGQPERVWWLGFDCAHSGDYRPATDERIHAINQKYPIHDHEQYRDLRYVEHECRKLAEQLARTESK